MSILRTLAAHLAALTLATTAGVLRARQETR